MNIHGFSLAMLANRELTVDKNSKNSLANLKIGESIDAKILKILGDQLLIETNGEKFFGKSEIKFVEGQSISIIYEGATEGEIKFKINPAQGNTDNNSLESALLDMGIKFNAKNKTIASFLLDNELPVTKENLSIIEKVLSPMESVENQAQLDQLNDQLKVAVLLLKKELPVTKDLVNQILTTSKEANIGKILQLLEKNEEMSRNNEMLKNNESLKNNEMLKFNEISINHQDKRIEPNLANTKINIAYNLNTEGEHHLRLEIMDRLTSLIKELIITNSSTSRENLVGQISDGGKDRNTEGNIQNGSGGGFTDTDNLTDNTKANITSALRNITDDSTVIRLFGLLDKIEGEIDRTSEYVRNARNPINDELDLKTDQTSNQNKVKEEIINLIKSFSKEVLLNTDRIVNSEFNNTYINIPLKVEDNWYPASLQIISEGEAGERINLDKKVYVTIGVETKNFEKVVVKLDMLKDRVNCSISVGNEIGYKLFSESCKELHHALEQSFKVVEVKVLKSYGLTTGLGQDNSKNNNTKFSRVDLRV